MKHKNRGFFVTKSSVARRFAAATMIFLLLINLAAPALWANPVGESIKAGNATFTRDGNNLIIKQGSDRMVVNWHAFSIGKGELTKFIQPGVKSSALNRVLGGSRSLIDGRLEANGQVILVNPNGITVGPNGVVNVNSFVGSTLDITDENFMTGGELKFSGDSEADVTNLGTIKAETGDVFILAKKIDNQGTIEAPNGTVGLGAGSEIVIQPDAAEKLYIATPSTKGGAINNAGAIRAAAAEIKAAGNPYALAINLDGVVDVKGTATKPAGTVKVDGGQGNVKVAKTAAIKARKADNSGGMITIASEASTGEVEVSGRLDARGDEGDGGSIALKGYSLRLDADSLVDASGQKSGGTVFIHGAKQVDAAGSLAVVGQSGKGGVITMLGENLVLRSTLFADASGFKGGGKIFVGGDYLGGKDPDRKYSDEALPTSERVTVLAGARLVADATSQGDGGVIINWSNDVTRFYGEASVRGGAKGGNGGFVEISGGNNLGFDGRVFLEAAKGTAGTVLFDPETLVIGHSAGSMDGNLPTIDFSTMPKDGTLSVSAIEAIKSGTVLLQANQTITLNDLSVGGDGVLDLQSGVSLTLMTKYGSIIFQNSANEIRASGGGAITLFAGNDPSATGALENIGRIETQGGKITLWGADGIFLKNAIVSNGGAVDIDGDADQGTVGQFILPKEASILTGGGDLLVKSGVVSARYQQTVILEGGVNLGAGRITFAATRSGVGVYVLGTTLYVSGDVLIDQPLTMNPGAGISTDGTIFLKNTVTMANEGSLTLRSSAVDFSLATFSNETAGALILEPYEASSNILVLGSDGVGGAYDLPTESYEKIANFKSMTVGRSDGEGTITLAQDMDAHQELTFLAGGKAGKFDLDKTITNTSTVRAMVGADITLGKNSQISSSAAGTAVTLVAGNNFYNRRDSSVVSTPNGNWQVWSTDPRQNENGGLIPNFKQYNAKYGTTAVLGAGNGFLYTIDPTLTAQLVGAVSKVYDGNTKAPVTKANVEVSGLIDNDDIGEQPWLASYDDANVGTGKLVALDKLDEVKITNGEIQVYGYKIQSEPAHIGTITPKELTITLNDVITKVYDGNGNATVGNDQVTIDGAVDGQKITLDLTKGKYNSADVISAMTVKFDSLKFDIAGGFLSNYILPETLSGKGQITPKGIVVAANGGQSTYGDSPVSPGFRADGLVDDQSINVLTGLSSSFDITALTDAGKYKVSVIGDLTNTNYKVDRSEDGSWSVLAKEIIVKANGGSSVYGADSDNPGLSAEGLVNGQTVEVLTGLYNDLLVSKYDSVGTYEANVAGHLANANYVVAKTESGSWTITPAPLTITANNQQKNYGTSFEFLGSEYTAVGLLNGDDPGLLKIISAGAPATADAGRYGIVVSLIKGEASRLFEKKSHFDSSNYDITYVAGVFNVVPSPITIRVVGGQSQQGQNPANPGLELVGGKLFNGDTLASLRLANSFGINPGTAAGNYLLRLLGGSSNYLITVVPGNWVVTASANAEAEQKIQAEQLAQPSPTSTNPAPRAFVDNLRFTPQFETKGPVEVQVEGFETMFSTMGLDREQGNQQVTDWGDQLDPDKDKREH